MINNQLEKLYIKYWLFRVCKNLFLDYARKDKEFSNADGLEDILTKDIFLNIAI